jgi:hypothetical protein
LWRGLSSLPCRRFFFSIDQEEPRRISAQQAESPRHAYRLDSIRMRAKTAVKWKKSYNFSAEIARPVRSVGSRADKFVDTKN